MAIFERLADRKIREAMAEGRFDDLPNEGRPLDLDEYFKLPVELRLSYSILKNAGCRPQEVDRLNVIARLEKELADANQSQRASLHAALEAERLALKLALEWAKRS